MSKKVVGEMICECRVGPSDVGSQKEILLLLGLGNGDEHT